MKKYQFMLLITIIAVFSLLTACKKFIEISAPNNELVTSNVFNYDASAISAQLSVYAQLESYVTTSLDFYSGLSSDELTYYGSNTTQIDTYKNLLNANTDGGWGSGINLYTLIYDENAVIENCQASTGMTSAAKNQLTGEALFTRSWLYFQLVNRYGDVPLILSTNYKTNSSLSRTATAAIYNQIVSDLKTAHGLLTPNYVDASDNPGAVDRVRPTTWAVDALLARVYLYMGNHGSDAVNAAMLVINNSSLYSLEPDLNKVFKANSSEAIWQLTPANGAYATSEGIQFVLNSPPATSNASTAISPKLLNTFESGDKRKIDWIGTYSDQNGSWNYPNKYKDGQSSVSVTTEYSMVLRLAEVYLIRADAYIAQGDVNDALKDLNAIRNRAGLANYSGATDAASVETAIQRERQVELFTENDRWYNLKRTGTINQVMSVVTPQKGRVQWQPFQALYPLAVSDLQLDPNLTQNPGY